MYARYTRVSGAPETVESRRVTFEERALPLMREQPGYRGVVVVSNAETGEGAVVSYWDSEEAMLRAADALAPTREQAFKAQGMAMVQTENYEVIGVHRSAPSKIGPSSRLITGGGATGDSSAALWREGSALASSLPGFCSVVYGLNRENGNFIIGSSWESDADRDASQERMAGLRSQMSGELGMTDVELVNYRVDLAEVPTTASAGT